MPLTRKRFLAAGAGAAFGLAGCSGLTPGLRSLEPESGPFPVPAGGEPDLISHVLGRAAFGPRRGDYGRVAALAPTPEKAVEAYLEQQLDPAGIDDTRLERALRRIESLSAPAGELYEFKDRVLLADHTRATILRALWSERQLFEVMAGFWTDHFNVDSSKGECKWLTVAHDRDVIRSRALGSFPELLRASALSPAMLWYLDGRVNRKQQGGDRANENYARELLELHTLGVHGGYTQHDVMEVARCLTGWTARSVKQFRKGTVEFAGEAHDDGAKSVLGHTIPAGLGRGDADRVLEIVSLHPSTARHLAEKLCRRFIADDPPESAIGRVAAAFSSHRGEIRPVLRTLFATPEFRQARRNKFKKPFEFLLSSLRATGARTDAGPPLLEYLQRMGHAPFQYPTPEGYPETAPHWMGTLLWRWRFAVALSGNAIAGTSIDSAALANAAGGDRNLMAHLLGRLPRAEESEAFGASGNGLALLLASPEFQMH